MGTSKYDAVSGYSDFGVLPGMTDLLLARRLDILDVESDQ